VKPIRALVIDDEPQVGGFVAQILQSEGWTVSEARTAEQAFEKLPESEWHLVFCDVVLGGIDGYEVLRQFKERQPQARVVLMTGHGSAVGALEAMATGAYDYLVKPFTIDDLLRISNSVREQHEFRRRQADSPNQSILTEQISAGYASDIPLIGRSPKFVECLKLVGRVAATSLPVLITGESGTGKEVVARAIHQRSDRAAGAFVPVNCGAIPFELIESELFGHVKGAFTGAERDRVGLWEEADGGAIFLDEITETSPLFQVKLLRALQTGEIRRVGSNRTLKVNVRVIAATNRDIEEEVRENRFRQDLMYRLNAVAIQLPPLRERVEDIPLLAEYFAAQARPSALAKVKFSPETLEALKNYEWRGNIRELENAVLHAASLADNIIYPEHLPARIREHRKAESDRTSALADLQIAEKGDYYERSSSSSSGEWLSLAEMEERYVAQVLAYTRSNKQAAARILNIDRKTLNRILERAKLSG
jgi:two-component system, NtrC family, response regulator AtoC